jgi:hypothetical protein
MGSSHCFFPQAPLTSKLDFADCVFLKRLACWELCSETWRIALFGILHKFIFVGIFCEPISFGRNQPVHSN